MASILSNSSQHHSARHGRRAARRTGHPPVSGGRLQQLYGFRYLHSLTRRQTEWLGCMLMALLGGLLRFIRLGSPHAVVFDETYYVKDAWTMLKTGEPRIWPKVLPPNQIPIDQAFAQGDVNQWLDQAEYVVHPPIGKWCIALGLKLFGGADNPFAWRVATAIAGTIAILLLCRVALRLFRNLPIAMMAGFLMSIDGLGIVMSRTGLLDNFIMVFALAAFLCLLGHRDWARARLRAAWKTDWRIERLHYRIRTPLPWPAQGKDDGWILATETTGPFIAWSWWRTGAAVLLGLATGTKWSGAYLFAVFALISVLWDAWERHKVGYGSWLKAGILKDGIPAALVMIPLWAGTYLASWIGWFRHSDSYMHGWAGGHPGQGLTWLPEGLRSLVEYHREMWQFHTTLDASHPYMANPLTWPLQVRPTSFYWQRFTDHPGLCSISPDSPCVAAVTSLGNPLIWWLGSACILIAIGLCLRAHRGDWRLWAVLAGLLGGWLPWIQYLNRTTFTFYSIVILPWMILGICYMADCVRHDTGQLVYRQMMCTTMIILGMTSLFFYPLWTAMPVPYWFWRIHMWLPSWI